MFISIKYPDIVIILKINFHNKSSKLLFPQIILQLSDLENRKYCIVICDSI